MINYTKISVIGLALSLSISATYAQDNLVNSLKNNQSENSASSFKFTEVINLANTPVQNQGSDRKSVV